LREEDAWVPTIGDYIREARCGYGMSQVQLARRIGVTAQTIRQIERNTTLDPAFSIVYRCAKVLGLSLDELIHEKKVWGNRAKRLPLPSSHPET
jgi:transcriptional regulator with XRE-family HTH domain